MIKSIVIRIEYSFAKYNVKTGERRLKSFVYGRPVDRAQWSKGTLCRRGRRTKDPRADKK